MRAERLVALLFTLQRKRSATAAELAQELGVSERTMHRDLAALREAGVPLWTETGRHGGFGLVDGWRTRLDGLTAREVVAMFALGAPAALADLGLGTAVSAAHAKVAAGLPADLREQARHVAGRFHLDAPAWFRDPDQAPELATVAEAAWSQHRLSVTYQRGSATVARVLEPLGLVLKAGVWYVVANVPSDDAVRTYRVSKLREARSLDERFERPDDFVLAEWWRESSANFEKTLLREEATVRLTRAALRLLPRVFGAEVVTGPVRELPEPGWVETTIGIETRQIALGQLTALGAEVEVVEPAELRAALAEVGAAMATRNQVLR